jgi:hypothetical protein
MNFKDKIRLEDFLLCTPYEKRGNRDLKIIDHEFLTEELFYHKLYSPPKSNNVADDEWRQGLSDLGFDEEEIKTLSQNIDSIKNFESALESDNTDPIFVRGYSGTGKTTFIRVSLFKLREDNKKREDKPNCHFVVLNMQDSLPNVYLFKGKWENKRYSKTIYKMVSMLLKYIESIMNREKRESNDSYMCRLKRIYAKYKNLFRGPSKTTDRDIDKVFDIISKYIGGEYIYNDGLNDSFCNAMHQAIVSFISDLPETATNDEVSGTITRLFELIYIWLLCESSDTDKHFILLDNIEHYIKNDIIYDDDITLIVKIVRQFISVIEDYFNQNGISYSSHFKVIFAIRDTTHKMIRYSEEQNADFLATHIDVSPFFSMNDIIKRKCDYFSASDIIMESKAILDMIQSITSDATLNQQISIMYNYNKRRMMTYLVRAISRDYDKVAKYKKLMEKSKDIKHQETKNAYKNGARSIIIRMLLDLIQRNTGENSVPDVNGYFTRAYTVQFQNLGFGFARRILVYLCNKAPVDTINESYIGFYSLIKDVFESPCNHRIPNNTFEIVSKILEALSDGDLERTHWCQLIVLQFNHSNTDSTSIADALERQYNSQNDIPGYGVKITDAGRSFVKFCTSFEYYSCRYTPQFPALFFSEQADNIIKLLDELLYKDKDENKNEGKVIQCIEKILETDDNYLRCGNDFINYEAQFSNRDIARYTLLHLRNNEQTIEQTQVAGIINRLIGYLHNYRLFLINENFKNKEEIMKKVLSVMKELIEKFSKVNNRNSEQNGEIYYYFGNQYKEMYDEIIKQYNSQIDEACKKPYDRNVWVIGKKK